MNAGANLIGKMCTVFEWCMWWCVYSPTLGMIKSEVFYNASSGRRSYSTARPDVFRADIGRQQEHCRTTYIDEASAVPYRESTWVLRIENDLADLVSAYSEI